MAGDGNSLRALGKTQHHELRRVLERVREEHRARAVLLAESCGRFLAAVGQDPQQDLDGLASLAASTLAAAGSLGGLMGEPGTSVCLQRGGQDLIRLEPAGELVLALVLDAESPRLGLEGVRARIRLRRAVAEMHSILAERPEAADLDRIGDEEVDALLAPMAATAE